jgi:MoaA/NifB/PqqE/SkfB family radical SAM enzyme
MGLLYTDKKIFHYREKIDSLPRQVEEILAPIHIRIKPTNVCNHSCSYCAYRADHLQLGQDMNLRDTIPLGKMLEIVDDIVDMGVKSVTFSGGGDPFCYPHLLETARKLSQSPVKFASLTNGARLTGEIAELFARHATWLRVSMDGWDDQSYRAYRGCPDGEFNRIIANMKNFKKVSEQCYLGVSLIVDQGNAEHVLEFIRMIKDIGVDSVKVSPCIVSNSGYENNRYHQPIFAKVKLALESALETVQDSRFEIFDSYHTFQGSFAKKYSWCPYQQILPIIGADLNVYSCQDKAYNLSDGLIGSVKDRSFRDFWFSDKNKFFSIDPSKVCDHHCVSNGKNRMLLDYLDADPEHLGFV